MNYTREVIALPIQAKTATSQDFYVKSGIDYHLDFPNAIIPSHNQYFKDIQINRVCPTNSG